MGDPWGPWGVRMERAVGDAHSELIDLTRRLIQAPSENPPCDQREVMGVVKDYLRGQGVAFEAPFLKPERENVVARVGPAGGSRSLILYGHTDVVPAGPVDLWSFPPTVGDVRDGFIRGRGAVDMKAGTAACLFVTALLQRLDVPLAGPLVLHANPDEEDYLVEEKMLYQLLDRGTLAGTACIMAEPSGLGSIGVADKGDVWLRLRTRGHSTHGSSPMLGRNAVEEALGAVAALRKLVVGPAHPPDALVPILPASRAAARARARALGLGPRAVAEAGRALDHTTVNLGRIRGGTMINVVPEACEVELALCTPPGESSAAVAERIRAGLRGRAEVDELTLSEPNFTDPRDPIVEATVEASRRVLGRAAQPIICPATSDAQVLRPRGIPTLFYGPGDLAMAHAVDERVQVEEVVTSAKVLALAALRYLGTSEGDPG